MVVFRIIILCHRAEARKERSPIAGNRSLPEVFQSMEKAWCFAFGFYCLHFLDLCMEFILPSSICLEAQWVWWIVKHHILSKYIWVLYTYFYFIHMCIHMSVQVPEDVREGVEPPGSAVIGYWELPDMGAAGSPLNYWIISLAPWILFFECDLI